MTRRRTLAGVFGALALVASTVAPALATTTTTASTNVEVGVTSTGVLSVAIDVSTAFDDINYSFSDQHSEGQLTVTVTDLRGTAAGWSFNLRASGDFTGAETTDSIPIGGLGFAFIETALIAGDANSLGVSGHNIQHVSTTGQQIASAIAGEGDGEYAILFFGDLLVPGDTLVDSYTTTLTVEVPSAP